ncbi:protoporphyrinogen oxidase isoform X1 [Electrophorus electricus]|uniref:protoporphyrinogen oxidase isoform X1 n=1 Tax=Electrophorus electricus TaxID=8005 RepID=UPI0015D08C96|nr:protoporphyrinogen oxidase isoform X1 [Electrophorus electricus]XP_026861198.2 protoporphyrinogen oxidase isoform X1 [Electrophorus electricus]
MQKAVAVLGGGIGGLSACYYLSKSSQVSKVVLLEATGRCGGWLRSTRREDGAVFEHGPRGVRPFGPAGQNTLNMLSELGLEREILAVPHDHVASKNRFLYVNGQLHRMPSSLSGVVHTVPPFSRPIILSVLKEVLVSKGKQEDECVHAFVSRRLGSELADIAIDSVCRGVFAGDSRQLSVRSCFHSLYSAEQAWGSVLLGMLMGKLMGSEKGLPVVPSELAQRAQKERWAQWSLRRGMQALPETLHEVLRGKERVEVHQNTPVKSLSRKPGGWEIKLEDGATLKVDHVISAVPASALALLLPPAAHSLSEQLRAIPTVTVAMVNLEFEGSVLPVKGFGHLVPSSEDLGLLGVVYDSVPFPQHNRRGDPTTRLTVMMGGAWFEETFGHPGEVKEQVLLDRASRVLRSHLGITATPSWSKAAVLKNCIPQYHVGHWKRLEMMRRYISDHGLPLTLTGASYDGVSVSDVIFSGRVAAECLTGKA